jgi:multiple sugar transport system permease protein
MRATGPTFERTQATIRSAFLVLVAFVFVLPVVVTATTALRSNADLLKRGLWVWPSPVYLDAFKTAWVDNGVGLFMRNSFVITVPSVIGALCCASLAAYALTQFRFGPRALVLALFFAGLFFPPQTFMVPVYMLTRRLGVYDTYLGLILVHIAYSLPFGVLTLSRFFSTIPSTLIDAARTDGASETHILVRIVWPLSANAIGAVAVFQFTWIWNDYFWGLVMTQSRSVQPVMVGITSAIGRLVFDWNGQSAASVIALIPPLLVFIFLQRIFVEGVRMGGVR